MLAGLDPFAEARPMSFAATRLATSLTLALVVCPSAAWAQAPALRDGGYFAAAQADRGRDIYVEQCASCHGRALD